MSSPTMGGWMVHVMRRADGALSLEEALHVIMDSMKEYFPCQSVAVILIDDDTKELRIKISRQISYTFVKKYHKDGPSATAERVVLEQQPVLLNDVDPESDLYRNLKLEHDFTSAVLAPIVKTQRGVGYIYGDRSGGDDFGESDLLHLQVIGYLIGHMMEKFDLIAHSKKLSQVDDASRALQYKAFVPAMGTELERAKTHEYDITLALLSVDAFRTYIETYGINAAHALLAEVVEIVRKHTSEMDILARFAADAFVLCLSGTDEEEGREKLQELKTAVFDEAVGQGDASIDLTVGGLVLTPGAGMRRSLQDILGALGKRLVEAKNQGGNTVVVAPME